MANGCLARRARWHGIALEPSDNPAAKVFKKAVFEQGIPLTAFAVNDIEKEPERMEKLGVHFTQKPTRMGPVTQAVFDDTCGNLIQIYQASELRRTSKRIER